MSNDWVIGVDLGGTKIEVGLIDPVNRLTARTRVLTLPHLGPRSVVDRIAAKVAEMAALLPQGERIAALGLCSPGPVDHEAGTLLDPPNLAGLHYAPLRRMLVEALGIPVEIDHDAKVTSLGEYHYGAGRGQRSMTYLIVGTGMGSATIIDGQLLRGLNNSAGEIGHVPLDRAGDLCSCGSRGCFETFTSGPWLVRRYQRKVQAAGLSCLPNVSPARLESSDAPKPATAQMPQSATSTELTAADVVDRALAGDPLASAVVEEAGKALGAAVATLAMVLDVDLFVLGGSVVKAGDLLIEPARRAVPMHCYRSVGCSVRIVATELGDDAPLLGCAWMARRALAKASTENGQRGVPLVSGETKTGNMTELARLRQVEGIIFNVQRFSVHDGPGVRTNVFFKGCPLRCAWCANPESHRFQPELGLSAHQCIGCGQFADICSEVWSHGAVTQLEKDKFAPRAEVCPGGALRWLGERRTAADVLAEVLRDLPFYRPAAEIDGDYARARPAPLLIQDGASATVNRPPLHGSPQHHPHRSCNVISCFEEESIAAPVGGPQAQTRCQLQAGGITLTGGEPTAQPDFAEALLRLAKDSGISTAMETCGHARWKVFERLLPHLDLVLFELKHLDSATHLRHTGADNQLVLNNLRRLEEVHAPVEVRVPLIPGFNADNESLSAIARFVANLRGPAKRVSLLLYHTLGKAKYAALGRPYPWEGHPVPSAEEVCAFSKIFEKNGLEVTVGS